MTERSLTQAAPFQVAGYCIEPASLRVTAGGDETRLEAKVMQVLLYLADHAGQVVSRAELEEQLWPGRIVTEDSVTKAIAKLRRVFGDDARHPRVIETVPKSGYRLIAEVTRIPDAVDEEAIAAQPTAAAERVARRANIRWVLGAVLLLLLFFGAVRLLERDRLLSRPPAPVSDKPAVAVVPFANLEPDRQEDYFADGITADLITDLSKVKGLTVIAPGSAFVYRNGEQDPKQISAELKVDYLVVGSVQRQDNTLRINIQLIESGAEQAVWGERFTGALNDVFDIQDKLSRTVIDALEVELAPAEQAYLAIRPTESIDAYDYYLRGLAEHGSRTESQNLSARSYFEKAIEFDPLFARAYTGLALTYSREAIDGWVADPSESLELAARFADKSTGMDPSLPQAHFVTGQVKLFQRRHAQAIAAAERAIEVDPNYADAYALLAWILNYAGRSDKATAALERAMTLSPRPPASYLEIDGEIQFAQGRYVESASAFQQVLDINPGYLRARMWNAAILARRGFRDNAEWEVGELLTASPHLAITRLEFAFPFKDPRTLENILESLKIAGVPEQ